jgi:sialidase-1
VIHPDETDLFLSNTSGYKMVRIPTMVVTPQGTILAFCKASVGGRRDRSDTLLRRSFDSGQTWEPAQVVIEGAWHPVPVVDRDNGAVLCVTSGPDDELKVVRSDDDGETWSPITTVAETDIKRSHWSRPSTGTTHGIHTRRGRIVVPCYHHDDNTNTRTSHVIYSDDHGETWHIGGSLAPRTEECTVLETADGRLIVNARRHRRDYYDGMPSWGYRATATSIDGGESFSETVADPNLPEPSCNGSLLRYTGQETHDRNRVLFSNPAAQDTRRNLTVRLSYDESTTWAHSKTLVAGAAHYSDLAVLPDMTICCLYEASAPGAKPGQDLSVTDTYNRVTFTRFDLDWLTDGQDEISK